MHLIQNVLLVNSISVQIENIQKIPMNLILVDEYYGEKFYEIS